jgi:hypothetical protein
MSKAYRLTLIALSLLILLVVGYALTGNMDFFLDNFWFTSGLLNNYADFPEEGVIQQNSML